MLFCQSGMVVTRLRDSASDLPSVVPAREEASGLNNTGRQKILEFQELNKEVVQLPWSGQKENPVLKQEAPTTKACWQRTHNRPALGPSTRGRYSAGCCRFTWSVLLWLGKGGSQTVTSSWSDSQHVEGLGNSPWEAGTRSVSCTLHVCMKQNPAQWR